MIEITRKGAVQWSYFVHNRRWRLFGNESQEKDFIVTGGLLWWREYVVMGCYNLAALRDEIRLYSRSEKLDNNFAKVVVVEAQVLLLNILDDQLVVFCADNVISIYNLCVVDPSVGPPTSLHLTKVRSYDASFIPGLNFHPACVVLVGLSTLKIETHRGTAAGPSSGGTSGIPSRDASTLRETSPALHNPADLPSLILNICGRVVMIQQQQPQNEMSRDGSGLPEGRDSPSQMALPTVLASGCETIWFPRAAGHTDKPHLTASLWLYCGAHGMRVWLPVFPREGDHGHTFM